MSQKGKNIGSFSPAVLIPLNAPMATVEGNASHGKCLSRGKDQPEPGAVAGGFGTATTSPCHPSNTADGGQSVSRGPSVALFQPGKLACEIHRRERNRQPNLLGSSLKTLRKVD
jgi:hypothetical protein